MRRRSNLAWLSVSAMLASCVVGCSADDSSTAPDGSTSLDATTDGPAKDEGTPDVKAGEGGGGTSDGSVQDGAIADVAVSDSTTDSPTMDAPADGGQQEDGSDADATATADAAEAGPPQPLALCTVLDSKFLINEADAGTARADQDRTQAWAYNIDSNFFNETGAYIGGDCSFSGFTQAVYSSTDMGFGYSADLNSWIQQFFGCPITGDAGALSYGLLPPELPGHVYTTGDLNRLSSDFVDGINNTLACAGDCIAGANTLPDGGTLANVAPLTSEQIASIRAELAYLQSQASTSLVDSGTFSFTVDPSCDPSSSCAALCPSPDAGASDASGD